MTTDNDATQGVKARTHTLKTDEDVWLALRDGTKTAEFRRDDRGFEVGDVLRLRHGTAETGIVLRRVISHIVRGPLFGIPEGYALLSLAPEPARDAAPADQADEYSISVRQALAFVRKWAPGDLACGTQSAQAKAEAALVLADAIDGRSPAAPPAQPASQADEPRCPDCGVRVPRDPALATEHVTHSTPTPAASSGLAAEFAALVPEYYDQLHTSVCIKVAKFAWNKRDKIQTALAIAEAVANPDDAMVERVAVMLSTEFEGSADDFRETFDEDRREQWRESARYAFKAIKIALSEGQQR